MNKLTLQTIIEYVLCLYNVCIVNSFYWKGEFVWTRASWPLLEQALAV